MTFTQYFLTENNTLDNLRLGDIIVIRCGKRPDGTLLPVARCKFLGQENKNTFTEDSNIVIKLLDKNHPCYTEKNENVEIKYIVRNLSAEQRKKHIKDLLNTEDDRLVDTLTDF